MSRLYNVKIVRSRRKTISIGVRRDGTVIVRAPLYMKNEEIESHLQSEQSFIEKALKKMQANISKAESLGLLSDEDIIALKKRAYECFPPRLEHFAELFGTDYSKLTVRCQHTRWGSCSSNGNISLNCLLLLVPDDVCDSVIAHEICHRKYMNHSRKFYAELLSKYPDYRRCERWLKENGNAILMRADILNTSR